MLRQVCFGVAAAAVSVNMVQAADLPLAEPAEYVKVCSTYGEGFFVIPGTQTCLQISGYARGDVSYNKPFSRDDDRVSFSSSGRLNFDARTETSYGTLRAYIRTQAEFTSNNSQDSNPALTAPPKNTEFYAEQAFVQFAGFTGGLITSFFDFYANENVFSFVAGSDQSTQVAAYTASFTEHFTGTIALEDRSYREVGIDGAGGVNGYGGTALPDVVGQLRLEQAWGAVQLSGALHQLRPSLGTVDTEYGFAVQAGVMFNLPMLAEGDTLYLQAAYASGAAAYLGPIDVAGIGTVDGSVNGAGNIERTDGFALAAELMHYWTPAVRSVFAASYLDLDSPASAIPAGFVDYNDIRVAGSLIWSPVKEFDIGVEVAYERTDYSGLPDEDTVNVIGRVERRF